MPAKTSKSATRKPKASSSKASRKSKASSSKASRKSKARASDSSSVISKTMTFTSNPSKGEPYGTFEEVVMKNGKGKRVTGKLNKSGKQFDKKESKINGRQSRCTAINITPLQINPLISGPGPAFFL